MKKTASNHHHHHHSGQTESNLRFDFMMNLLFTIVELIGGIFTGSIAILSDALHDFGDSISLGMAWRLQKIAAKKRDAKYSYGYKRFALLGALLISTVLLVGSVFVVSTAIKRLQNPVDIKVDSMLLLAIFGTLVNGLAVWRLSHGKSLSERAVRLHLLEDVLGWLAVLVVSLIMTFVNLPILDPLLSLVITVWVVFHAVQNLRNTFEVLLQGIPNNIDVSKLQQAILKLPEVLDLHDFHLWTLDGESHIMTVHVVCNPKTLVKAKQTAELKKSIREICQKFGISHVTIEFDSTDTSCDMKKC